MRHHRERRLMPKITALVAETAPVDGDLIPIVDVSDTTQSPSGSTNKSTLAQLAAGAPFTSRYFPLTGAVQATYNPNIVAATGATETISMNTAVHDLTMDQNCILTISDTAGSDEFKSCVVFIEGAFAITWDTDQDWGDATAPTYATPACFVILSKDNETRIYSASVGQAFG
jgi:hypothetical protein